MMLLYKDNYPYVVIEIYFHFMFGFLGSMIISGILCSFIFHISCDKDYLVYYDYLFFMCCLGLWAYNIGSLIIVIYIIELGFILFDFFFICVLLGS